jgi:8-oxo-dGTP pyrophosphatase MutT (NUDIX family)
LSNHSDPSGPIDPRLASYREPAAETPRLQACAVPFRRHGKILRYLIVTSSAGDRWIFPKGVVDPGYTPVETAIAEAFEEAGVRGVLYREPLYQYPRRKWGQEWNVLVYALECQEIAEDWTESYRERRWVTLEEAEPKLTSDLCQALRAVHAVLINGGPGREP